MIFKGRNLLKWTRLGTVGSIGVAAAVFEPLEKGPGQDYVELNEMDDEVEGNLFHPQGSKERGMSHRTWGLRWTKPDVVMDCARAVEKHRGHSVLLSWPYMSDDALRCAKSMHQGQLLYYVGEGEGGATANDAFFSYLRAGFKLVKEVEIPQFWGLHDSLEVWKRRKVT